jgi:hypothetical protein
MRGLVVELEVDRGTLRGLDVELFRGRRRVAHHFVVDVGTSRHRVVLRVHGQAPRRGRYTLVVRQGGRTLVSRAIAVRRAAEPGRKT